MNLQELKTLCENATPGPWEMQTGLLYARVFGPTEDGGPVCAGLLDEDAQFIAAARTALPKLIAAVEAVLGLTETAPTVIAWGDTPTSYIEGFDDGQDKGISLAVQAINNALEES